MIQSALISATSSTLVVTLLKSFGILAGAGGGRGVPADQRDARGVRLLDLPGHGLGVEAADDDAGGLESEGLGEGRPDTGGRALPVDGADVPADDLGRFLDALGDAGDTGVGHGLGDVGDGLAGGGLRSGGGAAPGGVDVLGLLDGLFRLGEDGGTTRLP